MLQTEWIFQLWGVYAQLPIIELILVIVGVAIAFFWLWFGIEINHTISDAPLAGRGYDGKIDNLFKCVCLLGWLLIILVPSQFVFYASAGSMLIMLYIRSYTGWIS